MNKGKILALDFGTKSIGYAISDEDRTMVFPRGAFINKEGILKEIEDFCEREKITTIVIGRPATAEGEESIQTKQAEEFGRKLEEAFHPHVVTHDERFTTEEARKYVRRFHGKADIDAVAASLILEEYLDLL